MTKLVITYRPAVSAAHCLKDTGKATGAKNWLLKCLRESSKILSLLNIEQEIQSNSAVSALKLANFFKS